MTFRAILLTLAFLMIGTSIFAQTRNCGAMDHLEHQLETDPKRAEKLDRIEQHTQQFLNNPSRAVDGVITIPVVVHVVWNTNAENISDAQIQSQIDVLNDDFRRLNSDADNTWSQAADSEIEFCLATLDPNGNATNGITRTQTSNTSFSTNDAVKFDSQGGKDAWPASDYLNVWVCDISGGILGYAQFPGGPPATDGVVNDYQYFGTTGTATAPFDLGRTMTHEVGHWLNLRHIWGDGGCSVDDFVSDTPTSDAPNYGCATGHVSCSSTDMVENYMDYSDDACMNLFTAGQRDRMRALFDTGGARESILSSAACGPPADPTCNDGIQNQGETGVDCGGPCPNACPTCDDGIQNQGEEDVDCGGPNCAPCPCTGTSVTVTINLDNYPEETSWTITDDGGATVASGGTYGSQPDGSTVTIDVCLADGCYDFTINDTYGDGICCGYGNGSYAVTDDQGNTLASGGAFGSSETTNFCLGGGSGPTCDDGVMNGDEEGVDCGGSACPPCNTGCSYVVINFNNFDSGWGIWNDGGSDCRRSANDATYALSQPRCVRLRDNTSTSVTTTDNLNLTAYDELTVSFTYLARSMDNSNEDFWLQVSTDGGASYNTVEEWNQGDEFVNNTRYFEDVVIPGPFTSNTRLRFRCDASGNSDWVYIDDVEISGCLNATRQSQPNTQIEISENITVEPITDLNLYPNPTRGELTIDFQTAQAGTIQLFVTDMNGKVVRLRELDVDAGVQQTQLDASRLGAGVYIVHMINAETRISKKFIVLED